jgi:membrane-bound lytic murein transglycosylase F
MVVFANRALHEEFMGEMEEFVKSEGYASMLGVYFGGNSPSEHFAQLKYRPTRVVNGISIWDKQLKSIAEKIGVDWRLMSAMAYHESRFRNDQISHKGAVGLMQVTPIVAQEFKLDDGYDLSDPSTNITLAAKLIRRSSRALGFGDFPNSDDGLAIVVASYNCGITRTLEAQRLVVAEGGDGSSWEAIRQMMINMSNAEWIATSDYKMRRFGDAPVTIAYTEGVMELYSIYRLALD